MVELPDDVQQPSARVSADEYDSAIIFLYQRDDLSKDAKDVTVVANIGLLVLDAMLPNAGLDFFHAPLRTHGKFAYPRQRVEYLHEIARESSGSLDECLK